MHRLVLFLTLLILICGPGRGQSRPGQSRPDSVQNTALRSDSVLVDGRYRTFHFLKPAGPNATLVFVLHGSGGDGRGIRNSAKTLEKLAPAENILLVYPDGYKHYWNECRKTAQSAANQEDINEQGFFEGMIGYFDRKYLIDPDRVFAVGTSGGGHMAYKLALTMPDRFRAITALIANLPDSTNMDCSAAGKPLPVMIVNGTADKTNPDNGGEVKTNNISLGLVRSTARTFHYWATLAGYTGEPVKKALPDTDLADGRTIEQYTFQQSGKSEVTLLKVIGGGHDTNARDIDIYAETWAFFKRQLTIHNSR